MPGNMKQEMNMRYGNVEVDVATVARGSVFGNSTISAISGAQPNEQKYAWDAMGFSEWLQKELRKLGTDEMMDAVCCVRNGSVVVLTHDEAAEYRQREALAGIDKFHRQVKDQSRLNTNKMSPEVARQHEQNKLSNQMIGMGIKNTRETRVRQIQLQELGEKVAKEAAVTVARPVSA
jgi:hypothetical protein